MHGARGRGANGEESTMQGEDFRIARGPPQEKVRGCESGGGEARRRGERRCSTERRCPERRCHPTVPSARTSRGPQRRIARVSGTRRLEVGGPLAFEAPAANSRIRCSSRMAPIGRTAAHAAGERRKGTGDTTGVVSRRVFGRVQPSAGVFVGDSDQRAAWWV